MSDIKTGSLEGLFVHRIDEDGKIVNQGYIHKEEDIYVYIQLLTFTDGRANDILRVAKWTVGYTGESDAPNSGFWKLYGSEYSWRLAYYKEMEADGNLNIAPSAEEAVVMLHPHLAECDDSSEAGS